jgi:putative membrane protein
MIKQWEGSKEKQAYENDKILRDYLAIDRTRLANIRNLMASIRTSLYLVVSAVAILNIETLKGWYWATIPLFALSIVILISGLVIFFKIRHKIQTAYQEERK